MTEPKKNTRRRRSRRRRRPSVPPETSPPPAPSVPDAPPALPASTVDDGVPLDLELGTPENMFAARAAARLPEPERPFPTNRRAIFFDVENTSRPQHIARMIDFLKVDRLGHRTDFVAVGNWRVIGHDTARLLAGHGATLLHSAPSVGVKDWSDLRIAVAAGVWLGTARPGDALEIITDDRAFDAVGDVATGLGVAFRRLSYRGLTGMREAEPLPVTEPQVESPTAGRRRRGRRGGQGRREAPPTHDRPVRQAVAASVEPHTAPHDELLGVARELIRVSSSRAVTLDSLANALKARGFSRTPGSPRLITRLRRIRELAVSRSGHITLVGPQAEAAALDAGADSEPIEVEARMSDATPVAASEGDRQEARPPDERSWEERRAEVEAAQAMRNTVPVAVASQSPSTPSEIARDDGYRRRRSRRGGRRRRRHGAPATG